MDYDIIIIGGGPAGLSTALHLRQIAPHLAPRILILEKERYPRPKLCAGGLVADAEIILDRLGLDVSEIPHVDAGQIRFEFHGRGFGYRTPQKHALRIIRRDEFDNWLAQKTRAGGVEIRESTPVRNILPQTDGVIVETDRETFRAHVVVGADGSNGITRRCILPNAPAHTARLLEVITPTHPSSDSTDTHDQRQSNAYFEFSPVPKNIAGYIWDFPTQLGGQTMRCWGIYDTNLLANGKRPPLKAPLAEEMSRLGFDLNDYDIKGHPIRWFSPKNRMSTPRVLLAGDAAGSDPLLGEGISMALGYGLLAAREVKGAFEGGDFSFNGYKRRVVRSALGRSLIARWFIAHVFYLLKWAWFQAAVWWVMKPFVILIARVFVLNWGKRMQPGLQQVIRDRAQSAV